MKKISSKMTVYYKVLYPVFWFGFLAIFSLASLLGSIFGGEGGPGPWFFLFPVFMALFGYVLFKHLVFDLIDEVYDAGDFLLFRNSGTVVKVFLKDIKNVNYVAIGSPRRITMIVRHETELGKELSFAAPASANPFKKSKDVAELIDRIDQARSAESS